MYMYIIHFPDTSVPKMKKRPVSGPAGVVPGSGPAGVQGVHPVNSSVTEHPARPTSDPATRPSALTTEAPTPHGAPKQRVGKI